jgi:uncharacterized protein (DUF2235 family)
MFRLHLLDEPQNYMHNRFSMTNNSEPQDIKQVWFAGVHSDIGGGYPEKESGLSKWPLIWMIDEAIACGLTVDPRAVNQLAWGKQRKGSPFSYVAPGTSDPHDSMTNVWRVLEWIPKADKYKECRTRRSFFGHYIPGAEPRSIPEDALVHESVVRQMQTVTNYRPANLPSRYEIIPMRSNPPEADVRRSQ